MQKEKEMEHWVHTSAEKPEQPPFLEGIYRGDLESNAFLLKRI